MKGKVSVIIPTYNRKELLKKTLKSIFSQSLQPHEIIVVDNQSTDGTYEWLKNQSAIVGVQNKGINSPGAARNLGLSMSTGDYIKYFDSDDLMTFNTLESQEKSLKESGKGFVYSPYFYARESDITWDYSHPVILNYFPIPSNKPLYHFMMVYGLFITIPGMMFRRELLLEVGDWKEDIVSSEDWDYLFRISLVEPFPTHTNQCAFLYRLHGQQTTKSNFSHYQRDLQKKNMLMELFNKFIKRDVRFSKYEKLMFLNVLYELYLVNRNRENSMEELEDFNTPLNQLIWLYKRVIKKIGRMKSRSEWLPFHGPYISSHKISEYIQLIKSDS